jgi:phosphohistidine phosphatase SixA
MRHALIGTILTILIGFSALPAAHAQQVVYLIRHAEQMLDVDDPPLTKAGHKRAKAWAGILEKSGIKVVYTSKKRRTQQTGEHIAQALGIPLQSVPRKEVTRLVNNIRTRHADDPVLIVTHKRQMPKIFRELGLSRDVSENVTFPRDEYDHLFVVVPKGGSAPTVLHLRSR